MVRFFSTLVLAIASSVVLYSQSLELDVAYLSSPDLGGRGAGTRGEAKAADFIYNSMSQAGLEMLSSPSGRDFFILNGTDTLHSSNVVGIVEGYHPMLKRQYVVVGANMDHLGTNLLTVDGAQVSQVFPGANDNASGVAVMLEVARRVAATGYLFRRSVVFVAFGAKEQGMAGSWYFVNRSFPDVDSISVIVDVRQVGKSGPGNKFTYYTGVPNAEINQVVDGVSENGAFFIPSYKDGLMPQGDYLPFYERNIPVMLLTMGEDRTARTVRDTPELLDYETMDYISDFLYHFVREIANREQMIDRVEDIPQSQSGAYSSFEVDTPPKFFKGDVSNFLTDWVYTYLRYPQGALEQGISGTVVVEFIIEKDGTVTNVRAVRGDNPELEAEAVRVVKVSPKWTPGILGGEKVRVKYSLPIEFRLRKR